MIRSRRTRSASCPHGLKGLLAVGGGLDLKAFLLQLVLQGALHRQLVFDNQGLVLLIVSSFYLAYFLTASLSGNAMKNREPSPGLDSNQTGRRSLDHEAGDVEPQARTDRLGGDGVAARKNWERADASRLRDADARILDFDHGLLPHLAVGHRIKPPTGV